MQFGWRVRGLLLLALMATVTMMVLIQKKVSKSHMLEIVTYLEGYEPYPVEEGDPVCLTGVVGAVGRVESIRTLQNDRWKVVMLLDRRYQAQIPTDSVVMLTLPSLGRMPCSFSGERYRELGRLFEIDTTIDGRCPSTDFSHVCTANSTPAIEDHGVLRNSGRWFCGNHDPGVAVFCGSLLFFRPHWWEVVLVPILWLENFLVMDIGVIYIELVFLASLVIAGIAMPSFFIRRKVLARRKQRWVGHGTPTKRDVNDT